MLYRGEDNAPICKRENCGREMIWTAQYGWHCPDAQCRQQQFEQMVRKLANGRAQLGRPAKAPKWGGDE